MSDRRALLRLQVDHAALRLKVAPIKFGLGNKYNPDQPRVSAGSPHGGQWVGAGGGSAFGARSRTPQENPRRVRTAQVVMGSLVTQPGSGRDIRCVYRFGFGDVVVQGSVLGTCQDRVPPSAVVHGRMLNDNRKG